jgi:glycosyltransferase involved in cell wall biosynthesis
VLFISNLFPPTVEGGAELVAFRQASGLAARGLDVAVLAGTSLEGGREPGSIDIDEIDGVPVYRVPLPEMDHNQNFHRPGTAGYLKALIAAHQPEIVHFHNVMRLGANLIPGAKQAGAKVVVTLHDHWGFCFKNTVVRNNGRICSNPHECAGCEPWVKAESGRSLPMRLRRDYVAWCLEQADLLISPSEYLVGAYRAAGITTKIEWLSSGVDLAAVSATVKPPSTQLRFVCLAYIGEHKGIPVLLEAAERLANDTTLAGRWSLTIAGPGHLAESLKKDIAGGRFAAAVRYLGQLCHQDAIKLMNASDVLILASIWPENEPVTLVEAIASGTAQLASRIGGIPGLVQEGKSGLLFEPGSADDLFHKMRLYISDSALAARHGAWNRDRRDEFDGARTLDRLQQLYNEQQLYNAEVRSSGTRTIICAGDCTEEIVLLLRRFHEIEDGRFRLRFIWHEWADSAAWRQARLLWLWPATPPLATLTRALGLGLPILVPAGSAAYQLEQQTGLVLGYATYLEAAAAIAALAGLVDLPSSREPAPDLVRLLASIAGKDCFHLPAGAVA